MTPVHFPGVNVTYAEDQPEYKPLPVMKFPNGQLISKWELSDEELAEIVKNKGFYIGHMTFGMPLQPILPYAWVDPLFPELYEPCTFDSLKYGDIVLLFNKFAESGNQFDKKEVSSKGEDLICIMIDDKPLTEFPFNKDLSCAIPGVVIMAKVREG